VYGDLVGDGVNIAARLAGVAEAEGLTPPVDFPGLAGFGKCRALAYIVWHGLKITRAQHQSTMAALSTLGDTHKLGYEALSMAVHHLERRVGELEARR
jgi:hypothetical protein